jgi:glycerol-3-phosphate dehydrogenase
LTLPERCDLLVIGGGINGAGIARDAAGRGLKVVLLEQSDLAAATSSASTKLVHGGLRYLEHFEFRLVRESLIERERLLAIAPHIIFPMRFVLPHVHGLRPRWQVRVGLFLYDHMGGRKRLPGSSSVALNREPFRSALGEHLRYGFAYSDCWVDDARLVVLNALDAAERGAHILVGHRFISAHREVGDWHVAYRNERTQAPLRLRARAIVNAAGPWVEQVLDNVSTANIRTRIRLVKGSHIVVPRLFSGDDAFLLQNPDGRVVFAIPYERSFTLIGTTDVAYEGDPASVAIDEPEIAYLCQTVNRYFRKQTTAADVRWTYAGVRPLLDDDEADASKITRDYRLDLSQVAGSTPLLAVFGGKITTYRGLANTAMQMLAPLLDAQRHEWTASAPLPGGDFPDANFERFLHECQRRWPFLTPPVAYRLARAYGTRLEHVLDGAQSLVQLGEHFGEGLTEAEVSYLRTREWAHSAQDVLWRRTKLGLHFSANQVQRLEQYLAR